MGLELRQQLKLSQNLVMTPQLQQAIKLLQLSRAELLEAVQQELMENPFLEEVEGVIKTPDNIAQIDRNGNVTEAAEIQATIESTDWADYLGEFSSSSKQSQVREYENAEDEGMAYDAKHSTKPSLSGHLYWQMSLSDFTDAELEVADVILGNLDHVGYLVATTEELSDLLEDVSDEFIEHVIKRMQGLDPVGVVARSLQECLEIQLAFFEYTDPILKTIIAEHLEDIQKQRFKPLAKKFSISLEELREYLNIIQSLDPMPGIQFSDSDVQYINPDVYVYQYGDELVVMLNEDGLPHLQLDDILSAAMEKSGGTDKEYFQEKKRSAEWLMKSLFQRQRTLFKVAESIVRFQRDFFLKGATSLRPLILREVAEDVSIHESTVSRITTNKYISTAFGLFELKYFFNSAIVMDDGSHVGSESVKAFIKRLISDENPQKPLSDEKIVDLLKNELEMNIARRTVAKYRMALGIDSSSKRKQVF